MLENIRKLREMTSLGVNDCKSAIKEAEGDFDKALALLKKRGASLLAKKSSRLASQGLIESYVHFGGNLGVLAEINCETDFVARTEVFKKFAKDIAMQIAASGAQYIKKEDVPQAELDSVPNAAAHIKQICLLEQSFIKDSKKTVDDYLKEVVSQIGENIVIRRFVRYSLGEDES